MRLPPGLALLSRAAAALAVFVAAVVVVGVWRMIPPGDNPFTPLNLEDPVGVFTAEKLARATADPDACMALVANSALQLSRIPDRAESDMCGYENAVAIERSVTPYSSPVNLSCPMAASLYLWEREVLQPLAEEHFGAPVARIEHVGTYACRRVYGGRTGDPSQHATANAIDVIGFRRADGNVVSVLNDWDDDTEEGAFLRDLHDRSCGVFRGVLGPDYNAQHADHFHLDMGPYALCR